MSTYRIEITEKYALDRRSGFDIVFNDLFRNLFRVAIGRGCGLDWRSFIDGVSIRLSIDGA